MNLKRQFDAYYQIDRSKKRVNFITTEEGDLDDYVYILTDQVLKSTKSKRYKFISEHKEVRQLVLEILNDEDNKGLFESNTMKIADRLLNSEIITEERYGHITELKKGSLIISKLYDDDFKYFLFSKVEHESFLNIDELKKQTGLPYDKGTLKTCLIKLDHTHEVLEIIVTDTNKKFASYWIDGFFELEELKSDEKNTLVSFNSMDQLLNRSVKKESPNDYTMIRNHLITYYRTADQFDFDDMIQTVFGEYKPESDNIEIDSLKQKAENLPNTKDFDRVFNIMHDEIKARIRRAVRLNELMELKINGSSEDLKSLIKAENFNGEKTLVIKTDNDQAYEMFNFRS